MRFALLGDHPDGLDMTRALVESGRHELAAYSGPPVGAEYLRRWGLRVEQVGDLEEILADPEVDAVIVAGSPGTRAAQLRRAVQSERHVLCVHPADQTADTAYEALMIQGDTGKVLMPLLPEASHPAFLSLAQLLRRGRVPSPPSEAVTARPPNGHLPPLGPGLRLVEVERWATEQVLLDADRPGHKPGLPGWDVLRLLGGEVAEVFAFGPEEEVTPYSPLLLAGRFEHGGLFQVSLLPLRPEPLWRLTALSDDDRAELTFAQGWPGPARLVWRDEAGAEREQTWESWNPWPALVEAFEAAVAAWERGGGSAVPVMLPAGVPTWRDEVRCLELDDAARRSVERRRASTLEYQEATEEASFKGTMALFGCGMLWVSLVLLILSRWVPWLGWVIAPLFGVFLVMQVFRWALPARPAPLAKPQGPHSTVGSSPGGLSALNPQDSKTRPGA